MKGFQNVKYTSPLVVQVNFSSPASYHPVLLTDNSLAQKLPQHCDNCDKRQLYCGDTGKGQRHFRGWTYWRIIAKGVICRQSWSIYLCQSSSGRFLSLHYSSLNIITPSIPSPCCLIIYLPLLSTCHSSTLFSCRSFSLFSVSPHVFSVCHPILCSSSSRCLPSFSQIKSWVLSSAQLTPPLSLTESCSPGGSAGEMDLLSLSLRHGGCLGDNSEPTSISISGTEQRPATTPHPPPRITFHSMLFFQVEKRKCRQRDGQRLGTWMEKGMI